MSTSKAIFGALIIMGVSGLLLTVLYGTPTVRQAVQDSIVMFVLGFAVLKFGDRLL
jgi:predicted benzoate:H+ symporter BenE